MDILQLKSKVFKRCRNICHHRILHRTSILKDFMMKKNESTIVKFNDLSSGEKQSVFTISTLVETIKRVGINEHAKIHILLATHSPFILSDIPMSNVLLLNREGKKEDCKESFCANIHDMLSKSFFMNYTIGEVARKCMI